jgi:tetratricopeptide (TPR) repeat protein
MTPRSTSEGAAHGAAPTARTRTVLATGAALVAAAAILLGGAFSGAPSSDSGQRDTVSRGSASADPVTRLLEGFSTGDTQRFVERLERRVAAERFDTDALVVLGLAYQQRARETGDPSFYSRSEAALRRAETYGGNEALVATGLASLAVARHDFDAAQAFARRALRADPEDASAYGALGDALLNRGRYREAFAAYDTMAAFAPGVASYARVAHARALLGRPAAAIEALELALDTRTPIAEHAAWTLVQLGNTYFADGRLEPAAEAYRTALRRLPGYVQGEVGLARVEAARGQLMRAAGRLRRAVDRLPLPEFAIALGDVLAASGRHAEANEVYGLVDAIERVFEANGVRTELQTALYDLDRGVRLPDALTRARQAYARGPSVQAEDVLAWGLYRNGRCEAARRHSIRALRLGTRDALAHFHRGAIERCVGNLEAGERFFAEALAINPHFSPRWAPVVREALR